MAASSFPCRGLQNLYSTHMAIIVMDQAYILEKCEEEISLHFICTFNERERQVIIDGNGYLRLYHFCPECKN